MYKRVRFIVIQSLLLISGLLAGQSGQEYITDFVGITKGYVRKVVKPATIPELQALVVKARYPLSIAGGRFSHGGHIWHPDSLVIDMTGLAEVIRLDTEKKTITVQAGACWREIQEYIIPYGLAVAVMQSFNDFTVGGSLSVNAHGRDIAYGPIVDTVISILVVCADGKLVSASRTENPDLFSAVIGGYGACGIIVQATLQLTDNYPIERVVTRMKLDEYCEYFKKHIRHNSLVVFHSAQLYEENSDEILSVSWYKTDKSLLQAVQIQKIQSSYLKEQLAHAVLVLPLFRKKMRILLDTLLYQNGSVVMRTYEMSTPVKVLEPLTKNDRAEVLQEYFVPLEKLTTFVALLRDTIWYHAINVLNISIRYVPQDSTTVLSYAPIQDMFAIVLFIDISTSEEYLKLVQIWTRKLIDAVLLVGGIYYLPYLPFATQEQFEKAYSNHTAFKAIKKQFDPTCKFVNNFTAQYLA